MRALILLLLCCVFYCCWSCTPQPTYKSIPLGEDVGTPTIIYYPYHKGIQLIELDFITPLIRANQVALEEERYKLESSQINHSFLDTNSLERSSSIDWIRSSSVNLDWRFRQQGGFPAPPQKVNGRNAYVLRNKAGGIVAYYNLSKKDLSKYTFISPREAQKLPPTYHLNREKYYFFQEQYGPNFYTPVSNIYRYKIISDKGVGMIDTLGNMLLEPIYEDIHCYGVGRRTPMYYLSKKGKTILANKDLKIMVSAKYDTLYPTEEGFYKVEQDGLMGLLDSSGREIIAPTHKDIATQYKDGFYRVFDGRKWGLLDSFGQIVSAMNYDEIGNFQNGFAVVVRQYKHGFIDTNMQEMCPLQYDKMTAFNKEGWAIVERNQHKGCINKEGVEVIRCKYDSINEHDTSDIVVVKVKNAILGQYNRDLEVIIPPIYRRIDDYIHDLCIVCKDTSLPMYDSNYTLPKCGFLDRAAKVAIPLTYDMVSNFKDGLCAACQRKGLTIDITCGFINRQNELVIPYLFQTKMYGVHLDINKEADEWRETKKFTKYLKKYKEAQEG